MKKSILTLAFGLLSLAAVAVPAKRIVKDVTLADGSVTTVTLTGDERCRFYLTPDNAVLMPDADGKLYFAAESTDGRLMRSDIPAIKVAPASANLAALQPAISRSMEAKTSTRMLAQAAATSSSDNPSKGVGLYVSPNIPGTGSPRCLIILVQYKDVSFTTTNPGVYFSSMANQKGFNKNGATGSISDYFVDASAGQFTPVFDVLGPVTLPQNRSYYGGNDYYGNDKAPEDMVRHAAAILDATVDFSVYDNNKDGVVDNVYIIYAGQGEASGGAANTVWPHSWDLSESSDGRYKVDGVYLDHYACSNEVTGSTPDGIGTFVHEFSHVLGLPDLYDTNYAVAAYITPNAYSVLDYGPYNNDGRTPPTYSVFERNAMGWMDCEVLDTPCDIEMEHILTSNKGYIIPTGNKNEFFLLENRQQAGWDKYIPGHGMLIWHIDYKSSVWLGGTVNNSSSHQYVDIEEACGTANSGSTTTMAGYPFPGTKKKTEFTSTTTPALKTWAEKAIDMPITEIAESNGVITALAAGGAPAPTLPVPEVAPASEITASGFTAFWQPVEGATDYQITVYSYTSGGTAQLPSIGFDGTVLPEGWTATNASDWYRSSSYSGENIPSFRISADGRYLQSPVIDGEINGLSFWSMVVSGSASKPYSTLKILAGDSKSTKVLATLDNITNQKGRYEVNADFSGVNQVTFVANISNGYIALDDIDISVKAQKSEIVDGYNARSTGGACSIAVTGLPEAERYAFSVVALNDEMQSKPSPLVFVSGPSGIEEIITDDASAPVEYFNLQGIRISRPAHGQTVIIKKGKNVKKTIF